MSTMGNQPPISQVSAAEGRARAEWEGLLARLQGSPETHARLQRVRGAIERGEFHVDARAVAERLLARQLTS